MDKTNLRFLDTNIILRYLTRDDEEKATQALALFTRLEAGTERVATSPMVIFEAIFTLQKRYNVPREKIREAIVDILSFSGLALPNKNLYRRALDLYVNNNISFTDAFNAAQMAAQRITDIYSFDTDFDRMDGVKRIEPREG